MLMRVLPFVLMLISGTACPAIARELDLTGYQEPNGAITTYYQGNTIDPYFATKALLLAKDGGLIVTKPSLAWIKWGLKAQRGDGLFNRYKRDANHNWIVYYVADADDAILAMWMELLYRSAPQSGLPLSWEESISKAEERLDELLDKQSGIYHISTTLPVGLLMDNTEIYAALKHMTQECKRLGLNEKAKVYQQKAAALRAGIKKTFERDSGDYTITTQTRDANDFYPDRVGQLFPLLYRVIDNAAIRHAYQEWLARNGKDWINQREHDYPWGLVATMAIDMGDVDSAACWQNLAEPMRGGGRWTIFEESALQYIKYRLTLEKYNKVPCVGGNLI
ncbi:MAG: hypothetical protein EBR02_01020 [Alphaproteobacteria bacterium]|nr:hypothetical protein [Alphaproteobacteria bacterium]